MKQDAILPGHFRRSEKVEEAVSFGPFGDDFTISEFPDRSKSGIFALVPRYFTAFAIAHFRSVKVPRVSHI